MSETEFKAALVSLLTGVVDNMIKSGQARDLPHAYSLLLEGILTPEQLQQFAVNQVFSRGSEAQNLLKGISLTRAREIFSDKPETEPGPQ